MAGGIFISYRREDSQHAAGRLVDRLTQSFGRDRIFMDVDAIETNQSESRMREIRTSGSMSGEERRSVGQQTPPPRFSSTLPDTPSQLASPPTGAIGLRSIAPYVSIAPVAPIERRQRAGLQVAAIFLRPASITIYPL